MTLAYYGAPFVTAFVEFRFTHGSLRGGHFDGFVITGWYGFIIAVGQREGVVGGLRTVGYFERVYRYRWIVSGFAVQFRLGREMAAAEELGVFRHSFFRRFFATYYLFKFQYVHARADGGILWFFRFFFFFLVAVTRRYLDWLT